MIFPLANDLKHRLALPRQLLTGFFLYSRRHE
jgi:hypothetical protein